MSSGPTFVGSDDEDEKVIKREYYLTREFTRKDWCIYKGKCLSEDLLINDDSVCLLCTYRIRLNIPDMLEKHKEEIEAKRKEEKDKREQEELERKLYEYESDIHPTIPE